MSVHKLTRRVRRLEDRHRREMIRLRDDIIRAMNHILAELLVDPDSGLPQAQLELAKKRRRKG